MSVGLDEVQSEEGSVTSEETNNNDTCQSSNNNTTTTPASVNTTHVTELLHPHSYKPGVKPTVPPFEKHAIFRCATKTHNQAFRSTFYLSNAAASWSLYIRSTLWARPSTVVFQWRVERSRRGP